MGLGKGLSLSIKPLLVWLITWKITQLDFIPFEPMVKASFARCLLWPGTLKETNKDSNCDGL